MFAPVYLDHNATSPLHPAVLEAMLPFMQARFGNPSSRHEYGRAARHAVDAARQQVAAAVGAHPTEVVFCSGGSEANNLFIKGAAAALKPGSVAVSRIEHPCVRKPAESLRKLGWSVSLIEVDGEGQVQPDSLLAAMKGDTRIVSVMLANNESGVLQDLATIAPVVRAGGAWLHTDAVQALGKIPVDFRALGVHGLTLSAHKVGGPMGVGALVLDKRVEVQPLVAGGGQERGLRSGTENVPGIVGFGVACERAALDVQARAAHMMVLREMLEKGLCGLGGQVFSANARRLPNTAFVGFDGMDGETLVAQLDRAGYAVASGAACSSANPEPSGTLTAMGVEPQLARSAIRISLGPETTEADVRGFLRAAGETLQRLGGLAAMAG